MRKLRLERRRSRSQLVTELGLDPGSLLPRGGQEQAGRALDVAVGRQDGLTTKRLGFASPWPGPRPQHHCFWWCGLRRAIPVASIFLVVK